MEPWLFVLLLAVGVQGTDWWMRTSIHYCPKPACDDCTSWHLGSSHDCPCRASRVVSTKPRVKCVTWLSQSALKTSPGVCANSHGSNYDLGLCEYPAIHRRRREGSTTSGQITSGPCPGSRLPTESVVPPSFVNCSLDDICKDNFHGTNW